MKTKLTLRLDQELIEIAKQTAAERGISVSRIVANYFSGLRRVNRRESEPLAPLTASLLGVIQGTCSDKNTYRKHLERKYR